METKLKKDIHSVLLINAGNDNTSPSVANYGIFPPLNILSIGSTLRKQFADIDVHICDGQLRSTHEINSNILSVRPDVVGISVLSSSYNNAIEHAKTAKSVHATTILGNDHAAMYKQNILCKFGSINGVQGKCIDYVCTADIAELIFCDFIRMLQSGDTKHLPSEISSETNDGGSNHLINEPGKHIDYVLDQIPLVDWRLVESDIYKYRVRLQNEYEGKLEGINAGSVAVTINRARGCPRWNNPCLYCGIADLRMRFSSPAVFWEEVRGAKNAVGANVFYEAFDDMGGSKVWVDGLLNSQPDDLKNVVNFIVYSDAVSVDEDLCDKYKELGVIMVNMGLDSGDDRMLKMLKSRYDSVEANRKATALLRRKKIGIYASFVLGAPGETEESLKKTVDFSNELMKSKRLAAIEVQPLYPLKNATAGKWLSNPDMAKHEARTRGFKIRNLERLREVSKDWNSDNVPDPKSISKDWVEIFCEATYENLENAIGQIKDYASKYDVNFGAAW